MTRSFKYTKAIEDGYLRRRVRNSEVKIQNLCATSASPVLCGFAEASIREAPRVPIFFYLELRN